MGYYVKITKSTLYIPHEVCDEVLRIWKAINGPEYDHLKRGFGFGKRNYSWMETDYDKICDSVEEVLEMLGFETASFELGVAITSYDDKMGQEDSFFACISHLISGRIDWDGEDGEKFSWVFDKSPTMQIVNNDMSIKRVSYPLLSFNEKG